ncbi:MAG TPA: cytochrome c oxidase accessory protein CcoG [Polyangia bacterium]
MPAAATPPPSAEAVTSRALRPDGRHETIVPLDAKGRFALARRVVFFALMGIYSSIPFVILGGHPAIHLDVVSRQFFLFGGSFNAQDTWMLALLVLAFFFALLFVTAWRGRVWCGWACPQTVFLEGLYRPVERWFEGSRSERLRIANHPMSIARRARTVAKHVVFVVLSLALGHAALIPFVPLGTMPALFADGPGAHPIAFGWAMTLSAVFYFDFAWFREQFCLVVCPYGRLQSALHDQHSIVIGYDARRGEPRRPLQRSTGLRVVAEAPAASGGDCVDCKKCAWTCPTGIDIRNGFQMECIACTQCIDVCDGVMDKIGRPRGLIRHDALNAFEGKPTKVLRPRLLLYGAAACIALVAFIASVGLRTPFEANVIRPVGVPFTVEGAQVRNQLEIHLVNKRPDHRRYQIAVDTPTGVVATVKTPRIALPSLAHVRIPIVLVGPLGAGVLPSDPSVVIRELDTGTERRVPVRLLAPR